jgi:hypothetical protein
MDQPKSDLSKLSPEAKSFLAHIGILVARWNEVEHYFLGIIEVILRAENAFVFVKQIGTPAQCDGLRALADELGDDDFKEHITHVTEYLSILREYRNFYIHGFREGGVDKDKKLVGIMSSMNLRGQVTIYRNLVSEKDVLSVIHQCESLLYYMGELMHDLTYLEFKDSDDIPVLRAPPLSSRKKPPLPERIQKLPYPQAAQSQPEASGEKS